MGVPIFRVSVSTFDVEFTIVIDCIDKLVNNTFILNCVSKALVPVSITFVLVFHCTLFL